MPTKTNTFTVAEAKEQLNTLEAKPSKALDKLSENFLNANFTTAQFIDCLNYRGKSDLSFILLLAKHGSEKNLYILLKKFSEILEKEPQVGNDVFGCLLLENDMGGNLGIAACAKSPACRQGFLNLLEQLLQKNFPAHTLLEYLMHTTTINQTLLMYVLHQDDADASNTYFNLLVAMLEKHPELSEKIFTHLMQQNVRRDTAFFLFHSPDIESIWYQFLLMFMFRVQPAQMMELLSLEGSTGLSIAAKTQSNFSNLFYILGYLMHQGASPHVVYDILIKGAYLNNLILDKTCHSYAYPLFHQLFDNGISANQIKLMYGKENFNNLVLYMVEYERNPQILYKLVAHQFLICTDDILNKTTATKNHYTTIKDIILQHIFNLPLEEKINALLNLKNMNHPLNRFITKVAGNNEIPKIKIQVDTELRQALEFQENQQHIASYYNASEYAAYTKGNLYPMFAPIEVHPPATPYPALNTQVPTGDLISLEDDNQESICPRNT